MYDLILVGGGLANGLIAWWMAKLHPNRQLLLVEKEGALGGNHTWSFYQEDLTPDQLALLAPMIAHEWDGYEVRFPEHSRFLETHCYSITSEKFRDVLMEAVGDAVVLNASVTEVGAEGICVDGVRLKARVVIDGRGHAASSRMRYAYQKFVGLEVILRSPHEQHFPIIMDATVSQEEGYRFVYTLPITKDRILVEDTYYSLTSDLNLAAVRQNIQSYIAKRGWDIDTVHREETGMLPIALSGDIDKFWGDERNGVPCSGMRAGLFHATTGYSLLFAVRLADHIARLEVLQADLVYRSIKTFSMQQWRDQAFMRLLNRMLFFSCAPDQRYRLLQRFYRLPQALIERFYAAHLTRIDKLRIVTGKPPVPLVPALRAALDTAVHPGKDLSSKPS